MKNLLILAVLAALVSVATTTSWENPYEELSAEEEILRSDRASDGSGDGSGDGDTTTTATPTTFSDDELELLPKRVSFRFDQDFDSIKDFVQDFIAKLQAFLRARTNNNKLKVLSAERGSIIVKVASEEQLANEIADQVKAGSLVFPYTNPNGDTVQYSANTESAVVEDNDTSSDNQKALAVGLAIGLLAIVIIVIILVVLNKNAKGKKQITPIDSNV